MTTTDHTDRLADPVENLLGTVRRKPNGKVIAVLWPSPPHPARWMVTDRWGSCGHETDAAVADWPVVGAVPFSPAAGFPFPGETDAIRESWKAADRV